MIPNRAAIGKAIRARQPRRAGRYRAEHGSGAAQSARCKTPELQSRKRTGQYDEDRRQVSVQIAPNSSLSSQTPKYGKTPRAAPPAQNHGNCAADVLQQTTLVFLSDPPRDACHGKLDQVLRQQADGVRLHEQDSVYPHVDCRHLHVHGKARDVDEIERYDRHGKHRKTRAKKV